MSSPFFHVLLHHSLVSALRQREPALRGLLQKRLERLQVGSWDGGTRVKLLRGVRKLVYEARLNRSLRLLFTVVRAASSQPPHRLDLYLLAWDIVDHDAIDRARRMNAEPESGFLDFQEVAHLEIAAPPVAPEAIVGEADGAELAAILGDPARAGGQVDELTAAIRWFEVDPDIVDDEAEWQVLLDDSSANDLELKLSREQAEALRLPGPVLLRGTAGSGKTTVSVYRLALAAMEHPAGRHLFVTYSESLLATARRLFLDLFHARRRPLPQELPDFVTFPDLYRRLAGQKFQHATLLRYPRFAEWYTTIYRRPDAALAWEEIRGIVKGSCLDTDRPCLSFAEYEQLGRKRAPLFTGERARLYQVYTSYAEWCRTRSLVDDIDLARAALTQLRLDPARRVDRVVCDEGQDLTELELRFLLELGRHPEGLFFTADPQQIVNPSGFRWAELRSQLRRATPSRTAPEIVSLTRNYRSVESVVSLANALIRVQRRRTGRSDDDHLQQTSLRGPSPVLVTGDEDEVLAHLRGFGPRCAIVVSCAAAAERLGRHLDSTRIFDVSTAKGLEFDGCVLWNVIGHDLALWQRLLATEEELKEDPSARRAIRHAYVAVTRARRYLGVYEADPVAARLWQTAELRPHVEQDSPDALAKFMLFAASPENWRTEGDYFLARSRYRQAAECYRRAGAEREEHFALAAYEESVGHDERAAVQFMQLAEHRRAAPCFARAGRHREAARCYAEVRLWAEAAASYEAAHQFRKAAEAWQNANDGDRYRRCLRQYHEASRNYVDAARIALRQGDTEGAIALYTRAGHHDQAQALRDRPAGEGGRTED